MPSDPGKRKLAIRWALRLVGPVLLAIVILRLDDPGRILEVVGGAKVAPFVGALLLNAVVLELKVVRWQWLLQVRGIRYPHRRALAAFLGALYIGLLTPGRVGDVLRVQYLKHDQDVPTSEGLASVVMDRFADLYVLAAFVAVGIARFSSVLEGSLGTAAWGTVALVVLCPLLLMVPGLSDRVLRAIAARFSDRAEEGSARFLAALRAHVGRSLLVTIPLTVAGFSVNYLQAWLIADALGLSMTILDVIGLMSVASLLGLLPISVSGVGVRELFFSLAFPALALTPDSGVTFGLMVLVTMHMALMLAGFVSFQISPPPTAKSTPAS